MHSVCNGVCTNTSVTLNESEVLFGNVCVGVCLNLCFAWVKIFFTPLTITFSIITISSLITSFLVNFSSALIDTFSILAHVSKFLAFSIRRTRLLHFDAFSALAFTFLAQLRGAGLAVGFAFAEDFAVEEAVFVDFASAVAALIAFVLAFLYDAVAGIAFALQAAVLALLFIRTHVDAFAVFAVSCFAAFLAFCFAGAGILAFLIQTLPVLAA